MTDFQLWQIADETKEKAYSPYSNIKVGAALMTEDGKVFTGVNVENSSFGATICAERNAIFNAISNGYKKHDFEKLYVMCDNEKIGMPCFACRQVISELFKEDAKVTCMNPQGESITLQVKDICPYPFGSEDLQ